MRIRQTQGISPREIMQKGIKRHNQAIDNFAQKLETTKQNLKTETNSFLDNLAKTLFPQPDLAYAGEGVVNEKSQTKKGEPLFKQFFEASDGPGMRNAEDPETGEYYDDDGYAWTDYNTYIAANSTHPEWEEFRELMDDLLDEASDGKWRTRDDEE